MAKTKSKGTLDWYGNPIPDEKIPRPQEGVRGERGADGKLYLRPWSQDGKPGKRVALEDTRCSCPDYEVNACKCKHIYAVEFAMLRERNADGSTTITEKVTVTATKRTTYPQNWPAYNEAQTNEKHHFQVMLHDLCQTIQNPVQTKGRRRLPLSDIVFAAIFKIYSTFSGRRLLCDLNDAQAKGYIAKAPHFNSIFNYLENPDLSPILTELIVQSSLPVG